MGEVAKPYNDWPIFKQKIVDPYKGKRTQVVVERLNILLCQQMLRRTKIDAENGKKLLNLPEREVEIVSMAFEDE